MAIKKEVMFDNGVKINYHRVNEIMVDNKNKKLKVSVISYTDDNYRKMELYNTANIKRYNELMELIIEENHKVEEDRNVEQVIKWSNESNDLTTKIRENVNLMVLETNYEFDEVEDFSMSNVYALLKGTDLFKDAEDI